MGFPEDECGDSVFVDVELELLSAGGSHQTQSLGVGFLPDFDGGEFVGGGFVVLGGDFWVGFSTVKVLPDVGHHSRVFDRKGPAGVVGGSGKDRDAGQGGERGCFVAHGGSGTREGVERGDDLEKPVCDTSKLVHDTFDSPKEKAEGMA